MGVAYHSREAFDTRMQQRKASPRPITPHAFFYHIACLNHWRDVVGEQLRLAAFAGVEHVYVVVLGGQNEGHIVEDIAAHAGVPITVMKCMPEIREFERPTLAALYQWCCANPDGAVSYFHTKGVSVPSWSQEGINKTHWRRLMNCEIIWQWQRNLKSLEEHDIIGVCWEEDRHWPHFCGNFWAARADWIAHLQEPDAYRVSRPDFVWAGGSWQQRFWCETWLGSQPWHHVESLRCKNEELWTDAIFRHDVSIPGFDWGPA